MRELSLSSGVVIAALLMIVGTTAINIRTYAIHNYAKVKTVGIGVYWDYGCTDECVEIDWGTIEAGETVTKSVYIRNESNVNVTLALETSDWAPSTAETYISLTWDYAEMQVAPEEVISVHLTLTVEPSVTGVDPFSFTIIITSVG